LYYDQVNGELEKANQVYELWAQAYPRDDVPHLNLSYNYAVIAQREKAETQAIEAVRLNPNNGVSYTNLAGAYVSLNRLDEAKAAYQQATARNSDIPQLHVGRYFAAFLEGDAAEMERQVAWAAGKPGVEDILFSTASATEEYFGHLGKGQELLRRAVESAQRSDEAETAGLYEAGGAQAQADFGNFERARQEIASALALASTRDVQVQVALALARAGDSNRAQAMADDLGKRFPLNTLVKNYWLPTIRAAIEINRNNPGKSIEFLHTTSPYELSTAGAMYPVYVRGLAYLLLTDGTKAAAEFQKLLNHRGVALNGPICALAHLGLARAYAMQGDTAKTRAAYQDFLTLWKDADPDIPILIAAKAEYQRLK
jgi:tetratricopeptide (TPR) repeat protein